MNRPIGGVPPEAYAAALAGIDSFGPARVERLLARWSPAEAFQATRSGAAASVWWRAEPGPRAARLAAHVRAEAHRIEPERTWARCQALGVRVLLRSSPDYPSVLADGLEPPPVLFVRGDLGALQARRVTIVGTRNATAGGRATAAELGRELADAQVGVVSGLARGIDGSAHRGVLAAIGGAAPIGVVASGHDVVYPPEHRALWRDVAERGVLLSEVPPGTTPHAYRFPLRNRILAALGELVVVVGSRARGGSLLTVDEAARRGITVLAVPGSPRSAASEGTNQLLVDGAAPVVGAADVLLALGFARPDDRRRRVAAPAMVEADDRWLFELLDGAPAHLDTLVQQSGRSLVEVTGCLVRLGEAGLVEARGGWFERRPLAGGAS